jgi:hypothetical protein
MRMMTIMMMVGRGMSGELWSMTWCVDLKV